MKKQTVFAMMTLLLAAMAVNAGAAGPEEILGIWSTEKDEAKVEIFKCADKYCGRIVWLKDQNYPPGSKPGTPKIDHKNPEPSLRSRPVMGLQFMSDFAYIGNNAWKGGRLYDPEKGKTYSGKMTLISPTQLDLRGFIGISLLGRTSKWTR